MLTQRIHFARTTDGVTIAYSSIGSGQPLLLMNGWVSHLELDMENPFNVQFLEGLSGDGRRRLIRLDLRGSGLSDRAAEDLSVEARARDIEAVVDSLGLAKVAIFAWSMNGPTAIVYAATHPEKVSHLILYGTYARQQGGERNALGHALVDLIRAEWRIGSRAIVEFEYPGADKEIADAINNYQRAAASGEVAATMLEEALFRTDVREYLSKLTMPTLVLHRRDDKAFPAACGRELAALLPHGHFVPLAGDVHPPFYGDTQSVVDAVNDFLATSDGHEPEPAVEAAQPAGESGLRIILFTDMEGSTKLTQRLGDAKAQELIRQHNAIVREALQAHDGAEIKHTGDGIMASFSSPSKAIECAVAVQKAFAEYNALILRRAQDERAGPGSARPEPVAGRGEVIRVRIGLNAGEPVSEGEDLFGTAVQMASRIAARARPGQILVSDVVRQLAAGKGVLFSDQGDVALRGFEDPVRLYEVRWQEA